MLIKRRRFVEGLAMSSAALTVRPAHAANGVLRPGPRPELFGPHFNLAISRMTANITGTRSWAYAINGSFPAPLLRWREGDDLTINVTNHLSESTSIHWHGIRVPNPMDGVPGLDFPGIAPGETFVYRFPVRQYGTYWYHSHTGYQEQKGHRGPLVIERRDEPIKADRDYVVMLTDWSDVDPRVIASNLKEDSGYYNTHKRTVSSFVDETAQRGLVPTLKSRLMWGKMRMMATGIAGVTGYTYTYLLNGLPPATNWTGLFRAGERIRLRFINGSAMTYFDIRVPGLKMTVVQADGNDVDPVTVDELRIAVAETYDVIVQPEQDIAYTIFAQSEDRSGYARGTLAPRVGMAGPVPPMDPRPLRTMLDMAMPMMNKGQWGESRPNLTRMGGMEKMAGGMAKGMKKMKPGMPISEKMTGGHPAVMAPDPDKPHMSYEVQTVAKMPTERLASAGDALNHLGRRVLTYEDLRALYRGSDPRPPSREIVLHLTGNMKRFIWGFNGKKFSQAEPIRLRLGERVRFRLINDTMMAHPIHLHGLWMELENGKGMHRPYKQTISVAPGEELCHLVTADTPGHWAYHCHLLYHFEEGGMFRTVLVS
ncbi:copper resistance system multicopper oxidase [Acidiphilium acidophilum]|uniref:copper resistance system multicopper oxidase n=1 Tax=Acidiphilium acidophilum TaxID=76588 RepID=UPI002E8E678A|nr:copper resistance system multicopper oxidase [Acidiphilium acidophilum]